MTRLSRRALARYAVEQLQAGRSAKSIAKNLAAALKESGKINELEFLINDIFWQLENQKQLTVGRVTSAHDLNQELRKSLKAQLKKMTEAKEVELEEVIDKSVLGGLRVETANHVWDDTAAKKLSQLKEAF